MSFHLKSFDNDSFPFKVFNYPLRLFHSCHILTLTFFCLNACIFLHNHSLALDLGFFLAFHFSSCFHFLHHLLLTHVLFLSPSLFLLSFSLSEHFSLFCCLHLLSHLFFEHALPLLFLTTN